MKNYVKLVVILLFIFLLSTACSTKSSKANEDNKNDNNIENKEENENNSDENKDNNDKNDNSDNNGINTGNHDDITDEELLNAIEQPNAEKLEKNPYDMTPKEIISKYLEAIKEDDFDTILELPPENDIEFQEQIIELTSKEDARSELRNRLSSFEETTVDDFKEKVDKETGIIDFEYDPGDYSFNLKFQFIVQGEKTRLLNVLVYDIPIFAYYNNAEGYGEGEGGPQPSATIFDEESKDEYEFSSLILNSPVTLEGFYEKEFSASFRGVSQGNLILFFSKGYDETITYDIKDDKRTVIEEFTTTPFINRNDNYIVYGSPEILGDPESEKNIMFFDYDQKSKQKVDVLSKGKFMTNAFVYKGVVFYSYNSEQYIAKGDSVSSAPVQGKYDESFYNSVSETIKNNNFDEITTDGNRLLASSSEDMKIYDLSSGDKKTIDTIESEDSHEIISLNVYEDRYVYDVLGNNESEFYVGSDSESAPIPNDTLNDALGVSLLDDNSIVYRTDENSYIYDIKKEESITIGTGQDLVPSGDKIFKTDFTYIKYKVK